MTTLRDKLVNQLEELPDVTTAFWKDTELLGVHFQGREIAHFQTGKCEIDIRLTPKIIKQKGLFPPKDSSSHPDRSKNSRWLLQSIEHEEDFGQIVELVQIAAELRANNS